MTFFYFSDFFMFILLSVSFQADITSPCCSLDFGFLFLGLSVLAQNCLSDLSGFILFLIYLFTQFKGAGTFKTISVMPQFSQHG